MDDSIDIGDYVSLSKNGTVFEVIDLPNSYGMLTLRALKSRNVVYVKEETLILCQKNP